MTEKDILNMVNDGKLEGHMPLFFLMRSHALQRVFFICCVTSNYLPFLEVFIFAI